MDLPKLRWSDGASPIEFESGIRPEARITIVLLTWGVMLLVVCVPLMHALPLVALFPVGLVAMVADHHPSLAEAARALAYLCYPTITSILLFTRRRALFWGLYSVWLVVFVINIVGFLKFLAMFASIRG